MSRIIKSTETKSRVMVGEAEGKCRVIANGFELEVMKMFSIVVRTAQLCEYVENYWIVHFQQVTWKNRLHNIRKYSKKTRMKDII